MERRRCKHCHLGQEFARTKSAISINGSQVYTSPSSFNDPLRASMQQLLGYGIHEHKVNSCAGIARIYFRNISFNVLLQRFAKEAVNLGLFRGH